MDNHVNDKDSLVFSRLADVRTSIGPAGRDRKGTHVHRSQTSAKSCQSELRRYVRSYAADDGSLPLAALP